MMVVRFARKLMARLYTAYVRARAARVGRDLTVNFYSNVTPQTFLGDNVNFNGMRIMGHGRVEIGNNFHSGRECLMITDVHNYEGSRIPYDHVILSKPIVIEDNVWIGTRVTILGGVRIGEGAIVQAGSVVVKDIPRCAIAGGHPAQVFSSRNVSHYEELKAQELFL